MALGRAEIRLALLLGDGHAPRQIAHTVGVTENNVRSEIKSIFSKTGVRRQSNLARLLLSNAQPRFRLVRDEAGIENTCVQSTEPAVTQSKALGRLNVTPGE
jgi:DNA-binding CsgD family transcriptional regulator